MIRAAPGLGRAGRPRSREVLFRHDCPSRGESAQPNWPDGRLKSRFDHHFVPLRGSLFFLPKGQILHHGDGVQECVKGLQGEVRLPALSDSLDSRRPRPSKNESLGLFDSPGSLRLSSRPGPGRCVATRESSGPGPALLKTSDSDPIPSVLRAISSDPSRWRSWKNENLTALLREPLVYDDSPGNEVVNGSFAFVEKQNDNFTPEPNPANGFNGFMPGRN